MESTNQQADDRILAEIGDRLGAERLTRNLTQAALARDAGVSTSTVGRLEAGQSVQLTSFIRLLRALGLIDRIGTLLPPARPGPMELLRGGGQPRQRASGGSGSRGGRSSREPWTWDAAETTETDPEDV